jgi:hypothetical protein
LASFALAAAAHEFAAVVELLFAALDWDVSEPLELLHATALSGSSARTAATR